MEHPNVQVIKRMDDAMATGDMATFFGSFTDDVVLHIGGNSQLSGEHRGVDTLQRLFGQFMAMSGEYSFVNHAYLADDEHGIILQRGTMKREGRELSTDEVFVMHLKDGKIKEFWYQPWDQAGIDAWWAAAPAHAAPA